MLQSDDMWYKTEYKAGKGERGEKKEWSEVSMSSKEHTNLPQTPMEKGLGEKKYQSLRAPAAEAVHFDSLFRAN